MHRLAYSCQPIADSRFISISYKLLAICYFHVDGLFKARVNPVVNDQFIHNVKITRFWGVFKNRVYRQFSRNLCSLFYSTKISFSDLLDNEFSTQSTSLITKTTNSIN